MKTISTWVFALTFTVFAPVWGQTELKLLQEQSLNAENGQIQISWEGGQAPFTLSADYQGSSQSVDLYSGSFSSYFMSGIPEGEHVFRLKDASNETLSFSINAAYPPVFQVKLFLFLGLLLFLLLTGIVTKGFLHSGRKTT